MLRNYDLNQFTRGILAGRPGVFQNVIVACEAKMTECGLKANDGAAVTTQPKHEGRRNPLRGQPLGSGDHNGRAVIDWIESIAPVNEADLSEDAEPAVREAALAMKQAHHDLVVVHATAKTRQ